MEYNNLNLSDFHLGVIDGSELNPVDSSGGRIVCFNGTGNEPLFMITIDPTFAACTISTIPTIPTIPVSSVPEPSMWALILIGGLLLTLLRKKEWMQPR